jgi:hypothetical protein
MVGTTKKPLRVDLASKGSRGAIARACRLNITRGLRSNDTENPGAFLTLTQTTPLISIRVNEHARVDNH